MKLKDLEKIFEDTNFPHWSCSKEELKVAKYLKQRCEDFGVKAKIEEFELPVSKIKEATLLADGVKIPCKGVFCCGSGEVEGEFYYMPGTDVASIAKARDKIVLMDAGGVGHFTYKSLVKAGAKAIIYQYGNIFFNSEDIDEKELRQKVVQDEKKILCATINVKDAITLVKNETKRLKLTLKQTESVGKSHNVVATIPGEIDEYIVLTAHYDSTVLSNGAYDNMSGCVGLLGIMEQMKKNKNHYGLKFVFCGSEERGLLGSAAYMEAHEKEIEKYVLNINIDMIGTYMGRFNSCITAEDKLSAYVSYMGAEVGFPVSTNVGVYPSDSTSFADKGVPALSFARAAANGVAPIHCKLDLKEVLSMKQLQKDIDFITLFTKRMACAAVCPVNREIPENIKKELDEYMFRKEKK